MYFPGPWDMSPGSRCGLINAGAPHSRVPSSQWDVVLSFSASIQASFSYSLLIIFFSEREFKIIISNGWKNDILKTDWKKSIIRKEKKLIQVHSDGQTPKIGKAHFFDGPIDIKIGPIIKLVRFSRESHFARVL